jgi:hypothetical protein
MILNIEPFIPTLSYVATFVGGIVAGVLAQSAKAHFDKDKDNWNDLKPDLQHIHPTIRNLSNNCDYASKINRDNSSPGLQSVLSSISSDLKDYLIWFTPFEGSLGITKLESIDQELSAALVGIFHFAKFCGTDQNYIEQKISKLKDITAVAEKRLKQFVRPNIIPHYVIFGKRKLRDWRDSKF